MRRAGIATCGVRHFGGKSGSDNAIIKRIAALVFAVVASLGGLPAHAADLPVPPHIKNEIPDARLAGQGDFKWLMLKIYGAQLWVGDAGFRSDAPAANVFALDLRYARSLEGKRIAESSKDEMQKLGLGSAEQHRIWLQKMTGLFPDVQEGSHITGVYLPAVGARFYLDGKPLGEILDPEFGRVFFAIWLDPKTSAPALRDALLRKAAPPDTAAARRP